MTNLTKKKISIKTAKEMNISYKQSEYLIDSLISIIKIKSKSRLIKISGFGTFNIKSTTERMGRNPLTMKSYLIKSRKKLNFTPSKKIKEFLN